MSGRIKRITSVSNPLIKEIRGLSRKKNRDATGTFMAEGMKLITDAIDQGWDVRTLIFAGQALADADLRQRVDDLAAKVHARGGSVLEVNQKVLGTITRRDNPQTVVGIIAQRLTPVARIEPGRAGLWVALERVRDPGNLGTIIRTADAVGADGVLLIGDVVDPFSLEVVRATMGSIFNIPVARMSADEFLKWRPGWPGIVVGAHLKGAVDHRSLSYRDSPVIVLMGNEQQGLPERLADACDHLARIAMDGRADSLNLAVATGLMLFEARRHALTLDSADDR